MDNSKESGIEPIWRNAEILLTRITINRDYVKNLLPKDITVHEDGRAIVFIANYPETTFGSVYKESAFLIHVRDKKGEAWSCPWMVVDDDTALILGRELLGFPKKLADIYLDAGTKTASGSVVRKGVEILRIEGSFDSEKKNIEPVFNQRMLNIFGSIVGGMYVLDIPATYENIISAKSGHGKLILNGTERDHLDLFAASCDCEIELIISDFGAGNGSLPELSEKLDDGFAASIFFSRAL
jgi:acetoacetate decarboxylase